VAPSRKQVQTIIDRPSRTGPYRDQAGGAASRHLAKSALRHWTKRAVRRCRAL